MKKYFHLLIIIFLFLSSPGLVFAHVRGVSITTINGKFTLVHPVQAVRSFVFNLPNDSDISAEEYIVGQTVDFVIDTSKLPVPEEIFQKTNFIWDFGDGSSKQTIKNGTKIAHRYTKPGTYIMTVHADYASAGFSDVGIQQIQATVLQILPYRGYVLPTVEVKINGQKSPESKSLSLDLNKKLTFQALTQKSSGKIVSYQWNFDDGKESTDQVVTHRYKLPQYYATPVVRVTDENGFFIDEYISIRNSGSNEPNDPQSEELTRLLLIIGGPILLTAITVLSILIVSYKRKKK